MIHPLLRHFAFAVALVSGPGIASAEEPADMPWSYSAGPADPTHWATDHPENEACGAGMDQSPVDIQLAIRADLPALDFQYTDMPASMTNSDNALVINVPPGQTLMVGERAFALQSISLHSPSTHAVGGKRSAMSALLTHTSAGGSLLVVEVFMQAGTVNTALAPLLMHLPRPGEQISVRNSSIRPGGLLPPDKGYFSLDGSLTTPPCSEGVDWIIMKTPITVGADQVLAFRRQFKDNVRPLQPLNGRVVRQPL